MTFRVGLDRARASIRRSQEALVREAREGHLSLAGIAGLERTLALGSLVVVAVASVLIIALAFRLPVPGAVIDVPGDQMAELTPVSIPLVVLVFVCVGLAIGAATLAVAVAASSDRARWLLAASVPLFLLGLGGLTLSTSRTVGILSENPSLVGAHQILGIWSVIAAGLVVALLVRWSRHRTILAAVAASPLVAMAVLQIVGSLAPLSLRPIDNAAFPANPVHLSEASMMSGAVMFLVGTAVSLLAVWAFWQTATWAQATARGSALELAPRADRLWWLLAIPLGAKLAWLAAGTASLLPPVFGGASDAWVRLHSDDLASVAYAAVLVAAGAWWLAHRETRLEDRWVERYAIYAIVAYGLLSILSDGLAMIQPALAVISPRITGDTIPDGVTLGACLGDWLPRGAEIFASCMRFVADDWSTVWGLLVLVGALVVGVVLWRRRGRRDAAAAFLVVLGLWTVPRAYGAVRTLSPAGLDTTGWPVFNAPQPETLDAVVTIFVAMLAVSWWTGRQRRVGPGALLIILVVSTLVVHGNTLLPTSPTIWLLGLVVVFPVAWELLFDSEDLNAATTGRSTLVLSTVGVRAVALALLVGLVAVDLVALAEDGNRQVGFVLFAPPFVAILLATTIGPVGHAGPPSGGPARPLLGVAAGAAIVALLAVASTTLSPLTQDLYAAGPARLEDLEARSQTAIMRIEAATTGEDLLAVWRAEDTWLGETTAPDCALPAWAAWRDLMGHVYQFGVVVVGAESGEAPDAGLRDRIEAHLRDLPIAIADDEAAFALDLADARKECDAT
jgi:hypothetical protein